MSELLDNKVDIQDENVKIKISRFTQSLIEVVMEKIRRKNDCYAKFFIERKTFIRLYQKTGWSNFDELWITDSTLNEGSY